MGGLDFNFLMKVFKQFSEGFEGKMSIIDKSHFPYK